MRFVAIALVLAITMSFTLATVVKVDYANDLVVVEVKTGHLYAFYGAEGWNVGDSAVLLVNVKTEDSTDDEIVWEWNIR